MSEPQDKRRPDAIELFMASLAATAIVYCAGAVIFAALSYFAQDGGWERVLQTLFILSFFGILLAAAVGFMLVAPLGTAIGLAMRRLSPPAWWQGPLTGALVAIALEVLVIGVLSTEVVRWSHGNAVTLSIPIVLSMFAGAYVQRRVLNWPNTQ